MKLSIKKYALLCFCGGEVFYLAFQEYGRMLNPREIDLHHSFFELIPGFVWGNVGSMVWGALLVGALFGAIGAYTAWMHNYSLEK